MNASVLRSRTPLKPVWPTRTSLDAASSSADSGRASKSQSHDSSSFGEAPRTSISIPHSRAAIVAFQIRGFGRYEKIRSLLMIVPLECRSPGFAKRSHLDVERPRAALLMRDVPRFVGDRGGLDEKLVRRLREHLACPLEVDDRIDDDVGDVHTLRPKIARDRLGEHALRRLGRREACE